MNNKKMFRFKSDCHGMLCCTLLTLCPFMWQIVTSLKLSLIIGFIIEWLSARIISVIWNKTLFLMFTGVTEWMLFMCWNISNQRTIKISWLRRTADWSSKFISWSTWISLGLCSSSKGSAFFLCYWKECKLLKSLEV